MVILLAAIWNFMSVRIYMNTEISVSRMLPSWCMQNELLLYFIKQKVVPCLLTRIFCLKAFYFHSLLSNIMKTILSNYLSWFIMFFFLTVILVPNIETLHFLPTFYNLGSVIYWFTSFCLRNLKPRIFQF